jgi:hypothetical protein
MVVDHLFAEQGVDRVSLLSQNSRSLLQRQINKICGIVED